MLRQGEGRVIITANFEDKIQKVRLPAMNDVDSVKDFFEILFEELRCEPFYEIFKHDIYDPEDEPLKNGIKRKSSGEHVTLTFSNSNTMPTLTACNLDDSPDNTSSSGMFFNPFTWKELKLLMNKIDIGKMVATVLSKVRVCSGLLKGYPITKMTRF